VQDGEAVRTKRDPRHTVQHGECNRRRAGGTANDGNARRPAKTGEPGSDRGKTCGTDNLAGLQQPLTTSLNKVRASHYLTPEPLYRLGGACGQHYILGIDGALAPGLNISNQRQPTSSRPLSRHCSVSLKNTTVWRGCNHLVHRLPDQAQKLACAAQWHRAVAHFHELFREWMASECRKLTVGWSGKAVSEGESCAVRVNAPTADGPFPNGARLLHDRDALFQ
jgi:hypothetical protein